jgi:hypothetical protein
VIQPDGSYTHTFGTKVNMQQVGKYYNFMFVTQMLTDKFTQNDTLRTVIRKLTSFDAGLKTPPRYNQEMCSNQLNLPVAIQNASAVPLTSVRINWKLNTDSWKSTVWNGNLAPGAVDTAFILASGMSPGQNQIAIATSLPNGSQDQDTKNDTISYRISGTGNGAYHYYKYESKVGHLVWEIRTAANTVAASGTTADPFIPDVCLNPGACYTLRLRPLSGNIWTGKWALFTQNDQLIYYTEEVEGVVNRPFCVTSRPSKDIGPWDAVTPNTSATLTNQEQLEVRIRNYGTTLATNIPISVRLGTGQIITEVIADTIQPGSLYSHRFQSVFNLSATQTPYQFTVVTTWPTDSVPKNDTLIHLVQKLLQSDLAIKGVIEEGFCGQLDGGFFQTTFRNEGAREIEEVILEVSLNGVTISDTVTLNLESQKSKTITLKHPDLAKWGNNSLTVTIRSVNKMGADQNTLNDRFDLSFTNTQVNTPLYALIDANQYGGLNGMSWKLVHDSDGAVLGSGGTYTDYQTSQQLAYCANAADCYTLTMYYPGASGWPGKFTFNSNSATVYTYAGAAFQDSLVYHFCSIDACASLQLQLDIKPLTAVGAADASVTLHGQGGTPPYFYSLNGTSFLLDSTFNGLAAGNYTAEVADINACKRAEPFTIGTSGTYTAINDVQIQILPNPVRDFVRVQIANTNESGTCVLRNIQGQVLLTDQLAPWGDDMRGVFSVVGLPDGVYFLSIYFGSGARTYRLVKG